MAGLQKLTQAEVKSAKQREKRYTLADGGGLILLVNPDGKRWWRFRYRYHGVPKMLSLGAFPDVSLKLARSKHQEARSLLADGIDPSAKRRAEREAAEDTFKAIFDEFLKQCRLGEESKKQARQRFDKHVLPYIGKRPIEAIDSQELLKVLRRVESRGTYETAGRIRSMCSRVFRYAIATGRASIDPAAALLGALQAPEEKHRATITSPKEIGALLRAIDAYEGYPATAAALKLAPLTFVRPGELRQAEWSEIDFDAREWRIPAEKMKMGREHVVPLSSQAVDVLHELELLTGDGRYLFPSIRTKERPMSDNTVNGALRRLGYGKDEMCGHGFRAMASTLLNELGYSPDHIERQLAHQHGNKVRKAYNHAQYLPKRRQMMQEWADYLDGLKAGAKVVPIHVA